MTEEPRQVKTTSFVYVRIVLSVNTSSTKKKVKYNYDRAEQRKLAPLVEHQT